jgi:hypothetical protein
MGDKSLEGAVIVSFQILDISLQKILILAEQIVYWKNLAENPRKLGALRLADDNVKLTSSQFGDKFRRWRALFLVFFNDGHPIMLCKWLVNKISKTANSLYVLYNISVLDKQQDSHRQILFYKTLNPVK